MHEKQGPLVGITVLEIVGLGPGPFCGMLLADLGADVLQVDRVGSRPTGMGALNRGKDAVSIDLKSEDGQNAFLRLVRNADVVIDVFRAGVAERLGIGPAECADANPGVVFARLTGYGQDGPMASAAGHDLNYLAVSGVLDLLGRADGPPTAPINLLADFAGGGMSCAIGILAALVERGVSGRGQVVDAAMIDGAALLAAPFFAGRANGGWGPRGTNMLDGAAPFYDCYECADGGWLAIGAIEPQFFATLIDVLGVDIDPADQWAMEQWPDQRDRISAAVATRTRDQWGAAFDGVDACAAPVLDPVEATTTDHATARSSFSIDADGLPQPAAAPRLGRTPGAAGPNLADDADPVRALHGWGLDESVARSLVDTGTVT